MKAGGGTFSTWPARTNRDEECTGLTSTTAIGDDIAVLTYTPVSDE